MPIVGVLLTDDEFEAVQALATRRAITPAQLLRFALQEELAAILRVFRERRWELRRRAVDADPALAATVDAALPEAP